MRVHLFTVLMALLWLTQTAAASGEHPCQATPEARWRCVLHEVSMAALLANPERFDGERIRTVGYLESDAIGNVLFFHREDYVNALHRNGVVLNTPVSPQCQRGRYVLLEGIFKPSNSTWDLSVAGSLDVLQCIPKI